MRVSTTQGDIDREKLDVTDEVMESDDARVVATVWSLDGKVVRRDVWVNPLRFKQVGTQKGL